MRKSLWIILTVLLVAIGAPVALADTIDTFIITASPQGIGGTLTVDVTTGIVTAVDITATGFTDFTTILVSAPFVGGWALNAGDASNNQLILLDFTTTTPSTLIGFEGGQITNGSIFRNNPPLNLIGITGTIVPAVATPEPSSLALMLSGIGLVFAMRKRIARGPNVLPNAPTANALSPFQAGQHGSS